MRDQHALDWPDQDTGQIRTRQGAIEKGCPPLTRSAGIWSANAVEPGNNGAPPFELIALKVLNQVGKAGSVGTGLSKSVGWARFFS